MRLIGTTPPAFYWEGKMKVEVKEIKPEPPPREFVITLTEREAGLLRKLVDNVGGTGGQLDSIRKELVNPLSGRLATVVKSLGETNGLYIS